LQEIPFSHSITLSPNPANDQLIIEVENARTAAFPFYNMQGIIGSMTLKGFPEIVCLWIFLPGFPGQYVVAFRTPNSLRTKIFQKL
jgi:hypothetical protein